MRSIPSTLSLYLIALLCFADFSLSKRHHGKQRNYQGQKKNIVTGRLAISPLKQLLETSKLDMKQHLKLDDLPGETKDSILQGANKHIPKIMVVMPKTGDMISLRTFHRLHPKNGSVTPLYNEDKQGRRVYFLPVAKKVEGSPGYVLAKNLLTMTKHTVDTFLGKHHLMESPGGGINIEKFTDGQSTSPSSKDTVFDDNLEENIEKGRLLNETKDSEEFDVVSQNDKSLLGTAHGDKKTQDVGNQDDDFETVNSFTKTPQTDQDIDDGAKRAINEKSSRDGSTEDDGVGAKRTIKKNTKNAKSAVSEDNNDLVDDIDYVNVVGPNTKDGKGSVENVGKETESNFHKQPTESVSESGFAKLRAKSIFENMAPTELSSFHKQLIYEGMELSDNEVFQEIADDKDEDEDEKDEESEFNKLKQSSEQNQAHPADPAVKKSQQQPRQKLAQPTDPVSSKKSQQQYNQKLAKSSDSWKKSQQQAGKRLEKESYGTQKNSQNKEVKEKQGPNLESNSTTKQHLQSAKSLGVKIRQEFVKNLAYTSDSKPKSIQQEFIGNLGQNSKYQKAPEVIQSRQSLVQPQSSLQNRKKEAPKKISPKFRPKFTQKQNKKIQPINQVFTHKPSVSGQQNHRASQSLMSSLNQQIDTHPSAVKVQQNIKQQSKKVSTAKHTAIKAPTQSFRFQTSSFARKNQHTNMSSTAAINKVVTTKPIRKLASKTLKSSSLKKVQQKPKTTLQAQQKLPTMLNLHPMQQTNQTYQQSYQTLQQYYQQNQQNTNQTYQSYAKQPTNQYYQQQQPTLQYYQQGDQKLIQNYQKPANKTKFNLEPNMTAFALTNLMKAITNSKNGTKINNSTSMDILSLPLQQPFANNKENQALINQFAKMYRQGLPLNKRPKSPDNSALESAYQAQYANQYNQYQSNLNYAAYAANQQQPYPSSTENTPESQYPDLQAYTKQSDPLSQGNEYSQYDANTVNAYSTTNQDSPQTDASNQPQNYDSNIASTFTTNAQSTLSQTPLSDQFTQSKLTQNAAFPTQDGSITNDFTKTAASVMGEEKELTSTNADQTAQEGPGNTPDNNAADPTISTSDATSLVSNGQDTALTPDATNQGAEFIEKTPSQEISAPYSTLSENVPLAPQQAINNYPVTFYPQQTQEYSESAAFSRTRGKNVTQKESKLTHQVSAANSVQHLTNNVDQDGFLISNDIRYPSPVFQMSSQQTEFLQTANKAMADVLRAKSSTENFIKNMNKNQNSQCCHTANTALAQQHNTAHSQQTVRPQYKVADQVASISQPNTNANVEVVQTPQVSATNYASNTNYYDPQKDYEPAALDAYLQPSTANYFDKYFSHNGIPDQRHHAKAYSFLHSFLRHVKSITHDPEFWKTQQPIQAVTQTAFKRNEITEPILEGHGNIRDHVAGRILSEPNYMLGDVGDVKKLLHGSGFNTFNDEDMKLLFGSPAAKKSETNGDEISKKTVTKASRNGVIFSKTNAAKKSESKTSMTKIPNTKSATNQAETAALHHKHQKKDKIFTTRDEIKIDEPAFLTLLLPEDDERISTQRGMKRSTSVHRRSKNPQERLHKPTRSKIPKKTKSVDLKALEFNGTE
ncbi:serine-rich adhesin for platelets-like isoform X1 [Clytia hemisphaerica]|uniref:Uncharacterized protein n=1 Tax=Clytia hemisphaerica TaxID=252671 RepID=A0A7M5WSQ2_9CNID